MMKRRMLIIGSLLVMILLITGCGDKAGVDNQVSENKKLDLTAVPEENVMPIADAPEKLTVVTNSQVTVNGKSSTYNDVKAFQEMEKVTGLKVDFQFLQNEKVNLLFASNDLPDIFLLNWDSFGGALKYARDGQIILLDSYMEKYASNMMKLINEMPTLYPQMVESDERVYSFPFIRGEEELRVFQGFQIRQDWLDKLGLPMPTTRDEFFSTLKAFKERDPNGNGTADEVPYVSEKKYGVERMFNWWGMDSFYVKDGQIKCGWVQPEFKDFVAYVKKMYEEGLLDPDFAVTDRMQFDFQVSNEICGAWYALSGSGVGRLTTLMEPINPDFEISALPWLMADDGNKYVVNSEYVNYVTGLGYAISSSCKDPEAAMKWIDFGYSREGQLLVNFGVEGESYVMKDGIPTYTELITNNPNGAPMSDMISVYAVPQGYPTLQSIHYFDQYMQPIQKRAINVWKDADISRSVPLLKYTLDESDIVTRKLNEITSYHNEMFSKFVTGKEPIKNIDVYVETIKKMGIDDVVKAKQTAYDRYKSAVENK